jgi:hypothetical protein
MSRGKPFQPGNQLGRGRPPGSRNKRNLAHQLLDQYGETIMRKTLALALQGDASLLQALLPYVVPRRKDSPVKTGPLRMHTIDDLSQTSEAIMKKVSSGQLTLSEAGEVASLLEGRRRIIETNEMEPRLRALESGPRDDGSAGQPVCERESPETEK